MVATTYSFQLLGVPVNVIQSLVDAAGSVTNPTTGPIQYITIDDSVLPELKAVMTSAGWSFIGVAPTAPPSSVQIRQRRITRLDTDQSTGSTAFLDLPTMTDTFDTGAGSLDIRLAASTSSLVTLGYLRIVVDGTPVTRAGTAHSVGTFGHSAFARVAVTAGSHTVKLQWRVDLGGTMDIRPVTNPDSESCSMVVEEAAS